MELLAILLGEFLFFPMIAAFGAVINLVFSLICGVAELSISVMMSSNSAPDKEKGSSRKKISLPFKWIAKISGSLFLVILLLLITVNTVLFAPVIGWISGKISQKTSIEISFEAVQGNIFTGYIEFEGLHAKRESTDKSNLDVIAKHIVLDVNIFSLITKPIIIETLMIDGVEGTLHSKTSDKLKEGQPKAETKKIKTKTEFIVEKLSIQNIDFQFSRIGKEPLKLSLNRIESAPFRSRYAVFDTFFRSNIEGSFNGHAITITSREEGDGRITNWHLDHFPVSIVNQYVQKAPISWFKSGVIDIRVEDQWEYGENAQINMDWDLKLKNVFVEAPEDASIISRTLSSPIVKYINNRSDVDIGFGLVMNENQFESTASLDAAGLWDAVIDSFSKKLALAAGKKKEAIKEGIQNKVDGFKNFLNKKRE